ncbi:MAG TPA: UDP-N-acetylmuramoyl-L-alanyl-D-glutamate--2,6-diaminopimelate ligase [Clostridiales bacterium]|nr:UDP-N-acetylmuramoyl-L-alanyl-D-glutamate--2,6-diaminopimelate ligase [Clostridiales bacterium]
MYLDSLLQQMNYKVINGDVHILITNLVYDSRKITKDSVFVCITGAISDGHDYIKSAIKAGALAVIVEKDIKIDSSITIIKVNNTRKALALMSVEYFGHPAEKLITIGITGTKGKTTTAYMIREALEKIGKKTGLIGTIETLIGEQTVPATNTTPESYVIQETFAKMVDAGCEYLVMEVSSQGLMLNRVEGIIFDYAIFTNLSPDHIGEHEHKDFEDYMNCKSKLFKQCKLGLVNIDDKNVDKIIQDSRCKVVGYGFSKTADFKADNIELFKREGVLGIKYNLTGLMECNVEVDIPGKFSVYNSLSAIALLYYLKIDKLNILEILNQVKVKGRVELIPISDKFTLIIDYAHNAMSLESLLSTLKKYKPKRLVCLFGCGGNRSKDRRYEMGEVSSRLADLTIVTSDNPRFEEPQDIIDDIIVGIKRANGNYIEIIDRKEAISYCISKAKDGDLIVLAGKGHEDYQEIKGVKYPMDERLIIKDIMA